MTTDPTSKPTTNPQNPLAEPLPERKPLISPTRLQDVSFDSRPGESIFRISAIKLRDSVQADNLGVPLKNGHTFAENLDKGRELLPKLGTVGFVGVVSVAVVWMMSVMLANPSQTTRIQSASIIPYATVVVPNESASSVTPGSIVDTTTAETVPQSSSGIDWPSILALSPATEWYNARVDGQPVIGKVVLLGERWENETTLSAWLFSFDVAYCGSFGAVGERVEIPLATGSSPTTAVLTAMPTTITASVCPDQDLSQFRFTAEPTDFPVQMAEYAVDGSWRQAPTMATEDGTVYVDANDPALYHVSVFLQEALAKAALTSSHCLNQAAAGVSEVIWNSVNDILPTPEGVDNPRAELEPYTGEIPLMIGQPFSVSPAEQQAMLSQGGTLSNFEVVSVEC